MTSRATEYNAAEFQEALTFETPVIGVEVWQWLSFERDHVVDQISQFCLKIIRKEFARLNQYRQSRVLIY